MNLFNLSIYQSIYQPIHQSINLSIDHTLTGLAVGDWVLGEEEKVADHDEVGDEKAGVGVLEVVAE